MTAAGRADERAMMDGRLIIGGLSTVERLIKNRKPGGTWRWCYFGGDVSMKEKLSQRWSVSRRIFYASELGGVAGALRQPFLDWVAALNGVNKNSLSWWAARLSSKNTLQTDFFLSLCYLELIKRWAGSDNMKCSDLYIVIEDAFLHAALAANMPQGGVGSGCVVMPWRDAVLGKELYYRFKAAACFFMRAIRSSWDILGSFLSWTRRWYQRARKPEDSPGVMLCTWLEPRCFNNGVFKDAYLGGLSDFFRRRGVKICIGSIGRLGPGLLGEITRLPDKVFIPDRMIDAMTSLRILFARIQSGLYLRRGERFLGNDISFILREEYLEEMSRSNFWDNLTVYHGFRAFFNRNRNLEAVIYPFEGQPWEKMAILAARHSESRAKTVAYQHTTFLPMLMSFSMGKGESDFAPTPDCIVANGGLNRDIFARQGFKRTRVLDGGSLRFARPACQVRNRHGRRKDDIPSIFLPLPSSTRNSLEAIYTVNRIFGAMAQACGIYVRPHPDNKDRRVTDAVMSMQGVEIVKGSKIEDILRKSDIVIYSASTVGLEALAMGVKLCKISSEYIDLDYMGSLGIDIYRAEDGADIDMDDLMSGSADAHAATASQLLYGPFNEKIWMEIGGITVRGNNTCLNEPTVAG